MYELQQSTDISHAGKPGRAFAVGAILGAGIALLLAPSPGRETRQRLGQTARRVGTGARGVLDRTRGTIEGVKRDARKAMQRGREAFAQARSPEENTGLRVQTR